MQAIPTFRGFGLGLRRPHYRDFLEGEVDVDFVEVISENFLVDGGRPLFVLEQVRAKHPVAMHGVSMSIGSAGGLDADYLARLKQLAERIDPLWVSDHLCWTRTSAHSSFDLLPLPYTEEALDLVCANIARAQDALGRAMLFENPSSYCSFPEDEMSEWEFIAEVTRRSGCYLLLDINNIYVSACNHGFDPLAYIAGIPSDRVRQVHLAGHTPGEINIDTHDRAVCDDVWRLYAAACELLGPVATMIERDEAIPSLAELLQELDRARELAKPEKCAV
jgi:uncharacterized protein (UPF0276 family)